ncbi:MAG: SDR family oxidoreductase [Proteobacteria bacterium]|nr:SDR family oxidoreductase [Pseudomonadota bacterium]
MRVLIPGGDGMLGHRLLKHLAPRHDVRVTLRRELSAYAGFGIFNDRNAYPRVDVHSDRLIEVMRAFRPEAVVNCIGLVKQRPDAEECRPGLEINALYPHRLADWCRDVKARLVHLSTDCVFSGQKGNYNEDDPFDAQDLYGQTKFLGEVCQPPCLTLRTSIVGPELSRKQGLIEWFLAQKGPINGFTNHIYTGLTTMEMGRVVEKLLIDHPRASGRYHVSSEPISKHDLLVLVKKKLGLPTEIRPHETPSPCDRSLDSTRFRQAFDYVPPTWEAMTDELCEELAKERK